MNTGMVSIWSARPIGEVCKVARGSSPRPICDQKYFDGGTIPWVKIADATKSGKRLYKTKQHVNEYGASYSRYLPAGTVIVAASGTLGYTQLLGVPGCVHDGWLYLTELNGVDKDYLYYTLQWTVRHFYNSAYGAAIQNINTEIMRATEIPLPPLPIQKKIAAVLSAYDDLIENNERRIKILEEIAQNLYREWFDNFRFPGHENVKLFDSPLGKIPEGWRIGSLGDLVILVKSRYSDKEHSSLPLVDMARMPHNTLAVNEAGLPSDLTTSRIVFEAGDVLFGSIRPYLHKVVRAPWQGVTNTSVFVLRPRSRLYAAVAPIILSSDVTIRWAVQYSTGTKMPVIKWDIFSSMPVAIPSAAISVLYHEHAMPLLTSVAKLATRNQNLRQTRDLLLPKLISGQLDISELDIEIPEQN